ncbi:MAG: helix-hairpin-helix domain-containing protein [Lachnospiraceae bacterium]|nr:helix-hairpin-helix domain-containing protein [Lachnospiraceae bacterium]
MKKPYMMFAVVLVFIACVFLNSCKKDSDGDAGLLELSTDGSEWEACDEEAAEEAAVTDKKPPETSGEKEDKPAEEEAPLTVTVYVCGEVLRPGVYELSEGARIVDVLMAAGGFTSAAADDYLNQAQMLTDGGKVYVPSRQELREGESLSVFADENTASDASGGGLININKADKTQLMTISGVGEAKAEKIIAYREEFGGFKAIEDIMNIPGIKEGMFSKIKDQICVK